LGAAPKAEKISCGFGTTSRKSRGEKGDLKTKKLRDNRFGRFRNRPEGWVISQAKKPSARAERVRKRTMREHVARYTKRRDETMPTGLGPKWFAEMKDTI